MSDQSIFGWWMNPNCYCTEILQMTAFARYMDLFSECKTNNYFVFLSRSAHSVTDHRIKAIFPHRNCLGWINFKSLQKTHYSMKYLMGSDDTGLLNFSFIIKGSNTNVCIFCMTECTRNICFTRNVNELRMLRCCDITLKKHSKQVCFSWSMQEVFYKERSELMFVVEKYKDLLRC